jgi:hypothetical protein
VSSKDFLTTLYESGISTEELRLLYLDETVGLKIWDEGVGEFDAKPNPYIAYSHIELKEALRALPPGEAWDYDREEIELTRQALRVAERTAIEALTTATFIALGYSASSKGDLVAIPPDQWRFVDLDFDQGAAQGEDAHYAGLNCIEQATLSKEDQELLKSATTSAETPEPSPSPSLSFPALGATCWADITLRLLKDNFVEVGGPAKKVKVNLDSLRLMNKTEQKTNDSFDLLLKIGKRPGVTTAKKQQISRLRKKLRTSLGTNEDPFSLHGTRYVPVFELIDDRKAADERAKADAVHVSYDDSRRYEGVEDETAYPFYEEEEKEEDKQGEKWLKEYDG